MKRFTFLLFICNFFVADSLQAQESSWSWQGASEGWTGAGACVIEPGPDFLTMTITGNQPHIQSPQNLNLDSSPFESFTVTLRNTTPGTTCQLKVFDDSNALSALIDIPVSAAMSEAASFTIPLSGLPAVIGKFRLRGPAGLGEGIVEWYDFGLNEPEPAITGCTDAIACNYDSAATEDDGSCTYNGANQPTDYLWQGTKAGWTGAGGVSLTAGDDYMTMSVTGSSNTAEMQSPTMLGLDASQFGSFSVRLSNPTSVTGGFQLRWYDDNNALLGNKSIPVGTQMTDFETYTVDLSSEESWSGNIGKLRLRGPFALDVAVEPTDILWESFLMNEILDCDGNCAQQIDECGVCGGEGLAEGACDCDGNVVDNCGECGGDGSSCAGLGVAIDDCGSFSNGSVDAWPHVLTATTVADGASSQAAQTMLINVTSLPSGAQYRVFKTTANGGNFFGEPQLLALGQNTVTVSAVGFDRTVKFQFSNGDVEFDFLSLNGVEEDDCYAVDPGILISVCEAFGEGPNNTWPFALTAATPDDPSSGDAQTLVLNVASLPEGGANYRVVKTVANGNWFNGNAQALSLGENTINVAAVAFTRSVKFQFSSGDVGIGAFSLNGSDLSCEPSVADPQGCTNSNATNFDADATEDDGSCTFDNPCNVDGVVVEVSSYAYSPSNLSIAVGQTVVWSNLGGLHDVNGDIDSQSGESFGNPEAFYLSPVSGNAEGVCIGSFTFNVPGVYNYDCSVGSHAALGMVASIVVGAGGCTDASAVNFDDTADYDDGSCILELFGCTYANAENYNAAATDDDGSCQFADAYAQGYDAGYADGLANCETADNSCPEDLDGDGEVATSDLLIFLSAFASSCD